MCYKVNNFIKNAYRLYPLKKLLITDIYFILQSNIDGLYSKIIF